MGKWTSSLESMGRLMVDLSFFINKNVFVTGHTGFKGAWLSKILVDAGAQLTGYSLLPPSEPNLFNILKLENKMNSIIGDIRDYDKLFSEFCKAKPEIVIHLAAQPLVIDGYNNPKYTYETNVMGTVNVLECIRKCDTVKSFLNVTTDKVYKNNEWEWGYRENELLDGYDPYSNSKSCSELVTHSYKASFFANNSVAISTARAGNVIGGGDFAKDRIIPDCIKAAVNGDTIIVRNPNSTRPYQHVLEPLFAYLMIVQMQYEDSSFSDWYNVGPDDSDCVKTSTLVDLFCDKWQNEITWKNINKDGPHEANFLKLDCSKIKQKLTWRPTWNIEIAIEKTVEWAKAYSENKDIIAVTKKQFEEFYCGGNNE